MGNDLGTALQCKTFKPHVMSLMAFRLSIDVFCVESVLCSRFSLTVVVPLPHLLPPPGRVDRGNESLRIYLEESAGDPTGEVKTL